MIKVLPKENKNLPPIPILINAREQAKKNVSKWMLATFIGVHLAVGSDFGFLIAIPNRKIRIAAKCFSTVMPLMFSMNFLHVFVGEFATMIPLTYDMSISTFRKVYIVQMLMYVSMKFVQYILYVIFFIFDKFTLFDYLFDLHLIDENVSLLTKKSVGIACAFYIYGMYLLKVSAFVPYGELYSGKTFTYDNFKTILIYYIYDSPYLCTDVAALELFFVYLGVYRIMKRMNDSFDNTSIDVKTVQTRYIALANCFYKIKSRYQIMLTLELVFDFPILLSLVWASLAFVRIEGASTSTFLASYLFQLHVIIQIVLPSWMAHKVTLQRNRLRLLLHERRIQNRADNPEVIRLLRYLDARQLQHTLWGVLPVDLQLPVGLFGLFTTYMIVIVQFTHLYD